MRDAVHRLCLLFRTHCLEFWRQGRELPDTSKRFLFIPKRLAISCSVDSYRSAYVFVCVYALSLCLRLRMC